MKKILDKIFKRPEIDLINIWKHRFIMRLLIGSAIIFSMVYFVIIKDIQAFIIAIILACSYQFMDYVVLNISKQISKEYHLVKKDVKKEEVYQYKHDSGC